MSDDFLKPEDLDNETNGQEDSSEIIDESENIELNANDDNSSEVSSDDASDTEQAPENEAANIFDITDIAEDEEDEDYQDYEEPPDLEEQLISNNFDTVSHNESKNDDFSSFEGDIYRDEEQKINEEFEKTAPFQEAPRTSLKEKDTRNNFLKYILFAGLIVILLVWLLQAAIRKFVGTPIENNQDYAMETAGSSDSAKFDPFRRPNTVNEEVVIPNGIEQSTQGEMEQIEPPKPPVNFAYIRANSKIDGKNNNVSATGTTEGGNIGATGSVFQQENSAPNNKTTMSADRYNATDFEMVTAQKLPFDMNLTLSKGTFIPCVMSTRFVSTIAGEISCTITDDVYSANGNVVLLNKGSKVFGQFNSANLDKGEKRMFVIWNEVRTPQNISIKIDSNATGELGESGASISVDNHFMQRFGVALLVSFVSSLSNFTSSALADRATHRKNSNEDNSDNDSNVRQMSDKQANDATAQASSIVTSILEKQMDIEPTGYKNQGEIIGIYVSRDVDFSNVYYLRRKL